MRRTSAGVSGPSGRAKAASARPPPIARAAAVAGTALRASGPWASTRPSAIAPPARAIDVEEDRVQQHEEREQRPRRAARAEAGAAEGPDRQGRAADAAGGQQSGRGRAAERDLRAGAEVEAVARAAADQPEQRDVADEGQDLEDRGGDDPARVGVERAAERVGELAERAAGGDDRHDGDDRDGGGHGRPARHGADVERRQGEVRSRVGGGHGGLQSRGAFQRSAALLFAAGAGSDACGRDGHARDRFSTRGCVRSRQPPPGLAGGISLPRGGAPGMLRSPPTTEEDTHPMSRRVAVVTGAGSGIGREVTHALLDDG